MTPFAAMDLAVKIGLTFELPANKLVEYAQAVAAIEREECAKVCEELAEFHRESEDEFMWQWEECAEVIRSRT